MTPTPGASVVVDGVTLEVVRVDACGVDVLRREGRWSREGRIGREQWAWLVAAQDHRR